MSSTVEPPHDPPLPDEAAEPPDKLVPEQIRAPTEVGGPLEPLRGKPTLGTISVGCALGYLDFRFGSHDWRAKRPKLAKWYGTFAKLPSMKATAPPPS